jgi:ABC-2 type transport system permease protein
MRGYLAFTRGSFMVGMIYRYGFLFTIAGNIVYMGIAYYLWRSIYKNAATMHGMTFHQTFLYVALGSAVFILLKTYADWGMSWEIREGYITNQLIKPIDYQLFNLFSSLGNVLINLAAITLPTLILLFVVFKIQITLGVGLLLFPLSLLLAFLVSFCFDYAVGLMAFFTESTWGLSMTKEIIVTALSGALVPLAFFPDVIQKVLYWLPFQTIYNIPLTMVTQPDRDPSQLLGMILIQVVWVAILFGLTRLLYNQAIKVLRISGG